jgi:hypothetical protein
VECIGKCLPRTKHLAGRGLGPTPKAWEGEGPYAMDFPMRGPNQKSTTRARSLRREQTSMEAKLWACLRNLSPIYRLDKVR